MIHMLIGIPGSGKSTYAKELKEELKCDVISTDYVRQSHPEWPESRIWPEVYRLSYLALVENRDVIFDATNITPKVRKRYIDEVENLGCNMSICGYYFDTPTKVCLERVMLRNLDPNELYLPPEVVESYGNRIIKPKLSEGFSSLKFIKNGEIVKTYGFKK